MGWDTLRAIEVMPAVHFQHRHHASNIPLRLRLRVTRNQLYVDAVVHVVTQSSSDQNIAIEQQLRSHPRVKPSVLQIAKKKVGVQDGRGEW